MKQLAVLLLLISMTACHKYSAHEPIKQDSAYVLFELDTRAHSTAVRWAYMAYMDTSVVVNDHVVHKLDTALFIQWPVTILDSTKKFALKSRIFPYGDSNQIQWVTLKKSAVLAVYHRK